MKNLLIDTVAKFNSPKKFKTIGESNPDLYKWIVETTAQYNPSSIIESIYIIINGPLLLCDVNTDKIPHKFISYTSGYRKFCSTVCKCSKTARTKKMIKKTEDELADILEKRKQTNLSRFGVEHPAQLTDIREKMKNTNVERYGTAYPSQLPEIREKINRTNVEKFGVVCNLQTTENKEKLKKSMISKYGVEYAMQSPDLLANITQAFVDKYGVTNPSHIPGVREKAQATNRARYGVDHAMQSLEIQQRATDTNIANLGVAYPIQSDHIRAAMIQTNLQRYGVANPSQIPSIIDKIKSTNRNLYGVDHVSQRHIKPETLHIISNADLFTELVKNKTLYEISNQLGVSVTTVLVYARNYNIRELIVPASRSSYEEKMIAFLDSNNISYQLHNRQLISPFELDFYIPSAKLAIEVGSNYYHSEYHGSKDKWYHYNKWKYCNDLGIALLQYFDKDILRHWNIIESKIKRISHIPTPVIGARKLKLVKLDDYKAESDFLSINHLQGPTSHRNLVIGAYYDQRLVGISSWLIDSDSKYTKLVRYATDVENSYPGLFSKMLNMFKSLSGFSGTLISFSDNRHSNGNLYKTMGFTLAYVSPPGYTYTNNFIDYESRILYQKHKLAKRLALDTDYVNTHTEQQIMKEHGFDRIWDAGQSKWILTI